MNHFLRYAVIFIIMVGGMLLLTWRLWIWNKAVTDYQPDISDHPELTANEESRIKRAYVYARLFPLFIIGFFLQTGVCLLCEAILGGIVKDESNMPTALMYVFIAFSVICLTGIVWTAIGAKTLTIGKRWKTILTKIEYMRHAKLKEPYTPATGKGRLLYSAGRLTGSKAAMSAGNVEMASEAGAAFAGISDYLKKVGKAAGIKLPNPEKALTGLLVIPAVIYISCTAVACVRAPGLIAQNRAYEAAIIGSVAENMEKDLVDVYSNSARARGHLPDDGNDTLSNAWVEVAVYEGKIVHIDYVIRATDFEDETTVYHDFENAVRTLNAGIAESALPDEWRALYLPGDDFREAYWDGTINDPKSGPFVLDAGGIRVRFVYHSGEANEEDPENDLAYREFLITVARK